MTGRITDVPGVLVGHRTLRQGSILTGVTAIVPHGGDLFRDKVMAASVTLNGFGKSVGLMQLDELGQLETPILLTNTFSVGVCAQALIRRAIASNPQIGRRISTVNPVVGECNDGYLNDIQAMAVTEADALAALDDARVAFARGAVGGGAGMSCFGFKGGIGTASRTIMLDGAAHTLGVLAQCNFGRSGDLRLDDGRRLAPPSLPVPEHGSVIVVVATDLPLDHRQLRRVIRRFGVGLARVGSYWGHGSGDVAIGFSTANNLPMAPKSDILAVRMMAEAKLDLAFQAMADATEDAVRDALMQAETTTGRDGHARPGLRETLEPS